MRNFGFNYQGMFVGSITTNDLATFVRDNNYIDVYFSKPYDRIKNIIIKCEGIEIAHPISVSRLKPNYQGSFFDLEWMKHFAKLGKKELLVEVFFDAQKMQDIRYRIIDGSFAIEFDPPKMKFNGQDVDRRKYLIPCPTQVTKHSSTAEFIVVSSDVLVFSENMIGDATDYEVGVNEINIEDFSIIYIDNYNTAFEGFLPYNVPYNECTDIELRIKNKYGVRGVIGGKIIANKTEGGDEQKTHADFTPIAGVWKYSRATAEVKVDVAFYFDGDADLLELLRDGCVYGQVEWYCEQSGEWLPCLIEDNGIDSNDAYAEHVVTIKLQDL